MTFKEAKLPKSIYLIFDNDEEIYEGILIEIVDINEAEDQCVLLVDNLMPQTAKLEVPYTALNESVMHMAGVHLFVDKEAAEEHLSK
jgi:hypothetical protein